MSSSLFRRALGRLGQELLPWDTNSTRTPMIKLPDANVKLSPKDVSLFFEKSKGKGSHRRAAVREW
jgi:hypothetical protein